MLLMLELLHQMKVRQQLPLWAGLGFLQFNLLAQHCYVPVCGCHWDHEIS